VGNLGRSETDPYGPFRDATLCAGERLPHAAWMSLEAGHCVGRSVAPEIEFYCRAQLVKVVASNGRPPPYELSQTWKKTPFSIDQTESN